MVKITEQLVRKKSEHNECLISTLEELSLHQEDIERIEHLQNWCRDLKILLLQSNLIAKIENLHKLKKLEYLNLAINNIERVENLQQLESLHKLDLTLNFIGDLTSIESLQGNYNLRELILTGNPCCEYPHYREFVIATLPQLESFDCEQVKQTHKLQARQRLQQFRTIIVQRQADYAIQRDEQKIRVLQQKQQLAAKMAGIADEDERIRTFWETKSEHCPEVREEIARYHKMCRQPNDATDGLVQPQRRTPQLFAPCGRPYNINQAKLPFLFKDERNEYILELDIYKFLDTSHINVDAEVNFIRVTVKGKIFQISLAEEIKTSETIVQRSQITGQLVIRASKLLVNEVLTSVTCRNKSQHSSTVDNDKRITGLKGTVNVNICNLEDEVPPLV